MAGMLICLLAAIFAAPVAAKSKSEKRSEAQKYLRLGQIHFEQGKTLEAIEALKKAIAIDGDLAEAHNYLGLIYLQKSQFKEARRELKKSVAIDPYNTDAYNNLGIVYREEGKFDKSIEVFEKALQDRAYRAPERIHLNLGYTYLARGDAPAAVPHFEKAVTLNAKYLLGYLGLGKAYQKAGRADLAQKTLRKVVDLGPDSPEAAEARQILSQQAPQGGA